MENLSKKERFVKVAEARTDKIISMIRLLGNCSNKNNYEYTDSQVNQIFEAISSELRSAKDKFKSKDKHFVLKDR